MYITWNYVIISERISRSVSRVAAIVTSLHYVKVFGEAASMPSPHQLFVSQPIQPVSTMFPYNH